MKSHLKSTSAIEHKKEYKSPILQDFGEIKHMTASGTLDIDENPGNDPDNKEFGTERA